MTIDDRQQEEREALIRHIQSKEEEERAKERASEANVPYKNYRFVFTQPDLLSLIPEQQAREQNIAIAERSGSALVLASLTPNDDIVRDIAQDLKSSHNTSVTIVGVSESSLEHLWSGYQKQREEREHHEGEAALQDDVIEELRASVSSFEDIAGLANQQSSTSRLLEIVFGSALALRASDIHMEPTEEHVRLRFRIDGVLHTVAQLSPLQGERAVSRIKLLSGMKLNITETPQDGRFTIHSDGTDVEVRSAVAPAEYGEDVVLRVLDPSTVQLNLSELGLRNDLLALMQSAITQPNGLILTTGPTGSGKTTTLYAFLQERNTSDIKIITIEDPVEYHLEGIEQTEINPSEGVTFFSGLTSALRRDPDLILVGEIRDDDTAHAAIQASLTGHLVFSTLHTNDAAGAIPRLVDLNVKSTLIPSALRIAIAQRLLRRLCSECAQTQPIDAQTKKTITNRLASVPDEYQPDNGGIELFVPSKKSCSACQGLGYRGRIGAFEILEIDESMEQFIEKTPSIADIRSYAIEHGMVTMEQDALLKALDGITSLEEVERVFGTYVPKNVSSL